MPGKPRIREQVEAPPMPASGDEAEVPVDLGPLIGYYGYYLRRLQQAYRRHYINLAGHLSIQPREVAILFAIGLNPGLTPSRLSGAIEADAAQITGSLKMFEARGLLLRRVSKIDGRSRELLLTPAGRRLLAKMTDMVNKVDRSFVGDSLSDQESQTLIRLMAKLYAGAPERHDSRPPRELS